MLISYVIRRRAASKRNHDIPFFWTYTNVRGSLVWQYDKPWAVTKINGPEGQNESVIRMRCSKISVSNSISSVWDIFQPFGAERLGLDLIENAKVLKDLSTSSMDTSFFCAANADLNRPFILRFLPVSSKFTVLKI